MKLPRLLMFVGAFILIFALVKILEQQSRGIEEESLLPYPLRGCRAEMDLDYLRPRNGNGYIRIPTRLGQARGIA